ncbi:gamma-aminobutyric acid receptor-associated protein-like 2 [Rattus rattus]|uniref:gamma-aminobutyric acid receptor-associated protein-like 2 n=1 Tax=Rattus rattus TaxID=10117 RepID=UPI0013F34175|nr:gamma-aminobutyric acid receptor-associated protein-like 2 [Rattus rattus]
MKWMFKEDHSLEHRCVESAKIRAKYPDRVPVSVDSPPPHPAVTLSVLERCREGALGRATVEKLRSQGVARDRTAWASSGPSLGKKGLVLFRGISAESSDLGQ